MGTGLSSLRDNIAWDRDADNSCFLAFSLVLSTVRSLIISPALISCPSSTLVESREAITLRPSLLDLGVPLSMHLAPETLSFCFCSCECNHGRTHVLLQGCHDSSYRDFHLHDVGVFFLHLLT